MWLLLKQCAISKSGRFSVLSSSLYLAIRSERRHRRAKSWSTRTQTDRQVRNRYASVSPGRWLILLVQPAFFAIKQPESSQSMPVIRQLDHCQPFLPRFNRSTFVTKRSSPTNCKIAQISRHFSPNLPKLLRSIHLTQSTEKNRDIQ